MEGGLPVSVQPRILQMAGSDPDSEVRRTAIGGLASIARPSPEVLEFWKRSLSDTANKSLRGMVLNSFRLSAPTDPDIVDLVIDALRDADRFVRQEAIAAVIQIGKPAAAAMPLLVEIRDSPASDDVLRVNATAAIRILTDAR
jgi:HEAT repeat protein